MTTKTIDSTIPTLNQDKSSVEYVDALENPIATIPNDGASSRNSGKTPLFDFNAEHNGVQCIESLKPEDRGTERQFWFSARMLATVFDCDDPKTIRSRIETLVNTGDLDEGKIFPSLNVPNHTGNGAVKTTLYNLTVFNKLAMTFIDNPRAVEVRKAFNDVLVKHETQPQAQPTIYDYARALIAEKERNDALEAQNKVLEAERDEAIRTKAQIGSNREATAMNTASQKSKECEKLREQIGDSKTYKRATAIPWLSEYFDTRNTGLYNSLAAQLKKIEASMPPEFAHKDNEDTRYGSVKAYHVAVIERFHEIVREKIPVDEKFMSKYRKDVSPKTKNV